MMILSKYPIIITSAIIFFIVFIFNFAPFSYAGSPTISKIITTQLHKEGDQVHKYQLEAVVKNPSGERIEAFWKVDCGSLNTDRGFKVVLSYSDDCSDAQVTLTVVNNKLYGQKLTQYVFLPGTLRIVNIKPKNQEPETQAVTTPKNPPLSLIPAVSQQKNFGQFPFVTNGVLTIAGLVLLAVILYALWKKYLSVKLISTDSKEKEQCKLGETRDCKLIGMKYSIYNRRPHEDEELDLFLEFSADATDIANWLISTRGTTPAVKMLPTFLRQTIEIHKNINKIEKLRDGVDIWGTIQWEECEEQGFWILASNSWVLKTKDIKISPPLYSYQMNTRAWNPEYMTNQKFIYSKLKEILSYVRKKALEECPGKQREI